jgi:16S rRNA processing protein RimM
VGEKVLRQSGKKTNLGAAKPNSALPPKVISPSPSVDTANLITIAYITRPQGLKGEVIATLETDFPERFADLESVFLLFPNGNIQESPLENYRFHKDRIVLKFPNINDRNGAEILRDVTVKIPSSALVPLPEEHYFEFDLIGCQVITNTGLDLGKVEELMYTGPAPLLVVKGTQEYLIPLAEEICYKIDIEQKKILVNPPQGLLEL